MERKRNKALAVVTAGVFLLGGCSSGESNNENRNNDDDNDGNSYSLNDGQPVYPSEEAANAREGACATFEEAVDITPADVNDVGGWLVLKLATPDLKDSLTPNSCPDDFVYANFK